MKLSKFLLVSGLSLVAFSAAQARSIKTKAVYVSQLESLNFQADESASTFYPLKNKFSFGSVEISVDKIVLENNYIEIKASGPVARCLARSRCMGAKPVVATIRVPYTAYDVGTCNERIYSGVQDQRPVDGDLKKITVVDNSTNTCKTFVELPATQVTVEEISSGFNPSHSITSSVTVFNGGKLETMK